MMMRFLCSLGWHIGTRREATLRPGTVVHTCRTCGLTRVIRRG